jgi:hypothetical protein
MITRRFTRVDLTNTTEDYFLKVGEEAYISFNNVTSIPLKIATTNNTFYELHLLNSNPGTNSYNIYNRKVYLYPNNISYNEFCVSGIYRSQFGFANMYSPSEPGFLVGWVFFVTIAWIINRRQYKNVRVIANLYGNSGYYPIIWESSSDWRNTTTEWSSLGTIVYPLLASGEIIVRRLI